MMSTIAEAWQAIKARERPSEQEARLVVHVPPLGARNDANPKCVAHGSTICPALRA
ncbi:hypothetical protein [Deinococcus yavapaiensis]|uniref:hypothetical protein n=1 Tax=Deinococcus yavapaiensis TaxID=309889 RepID=UPI0014752ACC|nr:hypothetical protein [Deinococcus yavapaiensis]